MITKAQAKYIQSLSDKKFRTETGCFVAEGPKIVNEFLEEGIVEPVAVYGLKEWISSSPPGNHQGVEVSERELAGISFLSTPNQVLGVFRIPYRNSSTTSNPLSSTEPNNSSISAKEAAPHVTALSTVELSQAPAFDFSGKLTLVLDGIQDPGNLGTIIRIADWFGIAAVVTSKDSADAYNPKVVQSTMGSIARVRIFSDNISEFLKQHDTIPVLAAALAGSSLKEHIEIREGFLVIGNESKGISPEIMKLATTRLTIPRIGKAESLNAAVATGIILSAITGRQ